MRIVLLNKVESLWENKMLLMYTAFRFYTRYIKALFTVEIVSWWTKWTNELIYKLIEWYNKKREKNGFKMKWIKEIKQLIFF